VWNLEKARLEYNVPPPALPRHANSEQVAISQNVEIIAVAFRNNNIALFSTCNCAKNLQLLVCIDLFDFIYQRKNSIYSICISEEGQLYVCADMPWRGMVIFDTIKLLSSINII
jgi:hypothetical protein